MWPEGTRWLCQPGAQWTALPEGGTISSPSPNTLCIKFCLQMKCPQTIQTADGDVTFHYNIIYEEACWLLAECWSFHCLDKTASTLQPPTCDQRTLQDRGTGVLRFWWRGWRCGAKNGWSPGEPRKPWHPFSAHSLALLLPSHRATLEAQWPVLSPPASDSIPPGWMNQVLEQKKQRLWNQTVLGWTLGSCCFYLPWACHLASLGLLVLVYKDLWSRFKTMQVKRPDQCLAALSASINVMFTHMLMCSHYQPSAGLEEQS